MLSTEMHAIHCNGFGDPDVMHMGTRPVLIPRNDEVLIKIVAAGINRADLMQRKGKYPPPKGASEILGLEVSGTIAAVGNEARRWKVGDRVCALLGGGGYCEYAIAPESHCLSIPEALSFVEAAALPEAITTVYANIFESAAVNPGETVLIHGGSSGIGTTAIRMLLLHGCKVFTTAGNDEKCHFCKQLGADLVVNYKAEDYVATVLSATQGRGVDVVLDMVGGDYIARNLSILAHGGRHVSIATQGGAKAEIDLRQVMMKRLVITGSTLRGRDAAEKTRLIAEIERNIWPWVAAGKLKPVIFQSFPLKNVVEAHKMMESGAHIGKIVLEIS